MVWSAQPDLTEAVRNVTEASSTDKDATPILARQARFLAGVARRAPSLHNTQPWRFTVSGDAIELQADASRQLTVDPDGREMFISCGAALYGLRLAVRSLGYLPEVEILPGPGRGRLARVRLGLGVPMTVGERKMLAAVPHRPVLIEFADASPGQDVAVAVAFGTGAAGVVAPAVPAPVSHDWLGVRMLRASELMPFMTLNFS